MILMERKNTYKVQGKYISIKKKKSKVLGSFFWSTKQLMTANALTVNDVVTLAQWKVKSCVKALGPQSVGDLAHSPSLPASEHNCGPSVSLLFLTSCVFNLDLDNIQPCLGLVPRSRFPVFFTLFLIILFSSP